MATYRIQEIHGNLYFIISEEDRKRKIATLRGKIRLLQKEHPFSISPRNPCCVGDYVSIRKPDKTQLYGNNPYVIENILPRKNILIRSSPYEMQLLGSNLDQAVLIVSLVQPDLKTGFIDRFLIACYSQNIQPMIFFTKCDLLSIQNKEHIELLKQALYYTKFIQNIYWDNLLSPGKRDPLFLVAAKIKDKHHQYSTDQFFTFYDFIKAIQNGTTILTGQSGTGKSTLTNLIMGENIQKTKEISTSTGKGKHTTTTSSLFFVSKNQVLIDTPGIKEWGLAHLTKKEIYESYPEWKKAIGSCKFRNCEHLPEIKGCAIQSEIQKQQLPAWRIQNLNWILQSLDYYDKIRPGDYKKPTGRFYNRFY